MSNSKTFRFENLKKVEIIKGTKRAAKKWSDKSNLIMYYMLIVIYIILL